jgi:hypothetical protein
MLGSVTIEDEMRALAQRLEARKHTLAAAIRERSLSDVPEFQAEQDPALHDATVRSVASALESIFEGLGHGRTVAAQPSAVAIEEARLAARAGRDLYALLRTYRVAQSVTWEAILEEAEAAIETRDSRIAVLTLASRFHFEWNDQVSRAIVAVYQTERDAMRRGRERQKEEFVRDVLRGLPVDESKVRYNLHGTHLAVIAWGAAPDDAVRALAGVLQGTSLTVAGSGGAINGFIAVRDGGRRLPLTDFEPPADTSIALGAPRAGVEGFRASHSQAQQAYRVARVRARTRVTRYEQVALEALVIGDVAHAREFMLNELGPLVGDGHRERGLRATLTAYFETGHNATSTARLLNVHERTVAYRLRSLEQRLGFPITERREELAVALRLYELLEEGEPGQRPDGA